MAESLRLYFQMYPSVSRAQVQTMLGLGLRDRGGNSREGTHGNQDR